MVLTRWNYSPGDISPVLPEFPGTAVVINGRPFVVFPMTAPLGLYRRINS